MRALFCATVFWNATTGKSEPSQRNSPAMVINGAASGGSIQEATAGHVRCTRFDGLFSTWRFVSVAAFLVYPDFGVKQERRTFQFTDVSVVEGINRIEYTGKNYFISSQVPARTGESSFRSSHLLLFSRSGDSTHTRSETRSRGLARGLGNLSLG